MPALNAHARTAVEAGRLAHMTTLNRDGSPQISAVWVGLDGDEIVLAHLGQGQKLRNLERDPRVALSIEAEGRNAAGLDHYLVVRGSARVSAGGGPELLQRLAKIYIGPDATFPPMPDPPPGHVVHITVEHVSGVGPWNEP